MTKHDTWVKLIPGNPLERCLHLFPDGIPMRDPFAMQHQRGNNGEAIAIWVIDLERLDRQQLTAVVEAIASQFDADPGEVMAEGARRGGFALNGAWIASMECGAEGMQRTKELADFLETAPQPPSVKAFNNFVNDQKRRWIDGSEVPPPLPTSIEEVDPRLVTPELEFALFLHRVETILNDPECKHPAASSEDGKEQLQG